MISTNTSIKKQLTPKAFWFYPEQKYVKIDDACKKQIATSKETPVLVFKENRIGQIQEFQELLLKKAKESGNVTKFYLALTVSYLKSLFYVTYATTKTA